MGLYSPEVLVDNPVSISSGTVSVDNFPATQPVTGPLTDAQLRATSVPVSGPLTDAQLRATPVPMSGTVTTSQLTSNSATVAQLALVGNTNTMLLAANPNRKKVILFTTGQPAYVKFGVGASTTSFTYKITAMNSTLEITVWTGQIDILSQSSQTVTVTEMV